MYVHQYNDNNVTDIYFSLLKICSYYNELGDFFNFPVKLNEQDINFLESTDDGENGHSKEEPAFNLLQNEAPHIGNEQPGNLIMDDNVLMDKPIENEEIVEEKGIEKEEEECKQKHPLLFDPDNNEEQRENHLGTFNILVTGRPGVGKSTIINLILGEKRCRENQGRTVTKKIVKYVHKKYPLCL